MFIKIYIFLLCLFFFFAPVHTMAAPDTFRIKSYLDSAASYTQSHELEKACTLYKKAIKLQDSIAAENYASEVKQLRSASQIDELYLQNTRQKNRTLTIVLILMGTFGLFITGALLYLKKKNTLLDKSTKQMQEAIQKSESSLKIKKLVLRELTDEVEHSLEEIEKSRRLESVKKIISGISSRLMLLLILLFSLSLSAAAFTQKQRDSIITVFSGMPTGMEKLSMLHKLIQQNNQSVYAGELAELLITEAKKQQNDSMELAGLQLAFTIPFSNADIEQTRIILEKIKEASWRIDKSYDRYYKMWGSLMQMLSSQGHTEEVKNEAKKMRAEAEENNSLSGKVAADMALANAYYFLKDNAEAIRILEKTLAEESNIPNTFLLSIYKKLYICSLNLKKYNQAAANLDKIAELMTSAPKANQRSNLLDYHTQYALVSYHQKKYDQMLKHLKEAQKSYDDYSFVSYFVMYHNVWALYHEHNKDWESSIREYDIAIKRLSTTQPMMKLGIQKNKAASLRKAGRLEEAVQEYRDIYNSGAELNRQFLQKQAKAIEENYRWELGLLTQARNENILKIGIIIFVSLLVLSLTGLLLRILKINKKLSEHERQVAKAATIAAQADQFRGILIKNTQIGLSTPTREMERLFNQIPPDKQEDYFTQEQVLLEIKQIAQKMLPLIKDVKELSFLESGQVLYTLGEYDVLALCYTAVEAHRANPRLDITFSSDIESQLIRTDKEKFLTFLSTIFLLPQNHKLTEKIEITLSYGTSGTDVVLSIIGTFLAKENSASEGFHLKNEINRLFIESLGGKYQLKKSSLRPELTVTLPFYR